MIHFFAKAASNFTRKIRNFKKNAFKNMATIIIIDKNPSL